MFAKLAWQGFNPTTHTEKLVGSKKHPQAVDPDFLVSWNNKQAPKFSAADDQHAYGLLQRSQMISDKVRKGTKGSRKMTLAQLVQAMELPATQDLRAYRALPPILEAIGKPGGKLGKALAKLRAWRRAGSFRRDLDQNGVYEHNDAVELMDAWWPLLVTAEFKPALGANAFSSLQAMQALGDHTRTIPNAPSFFSGWWGYVSRDLGRAVAKHGHHTASTAVTAP